MRGTWLVSFIVGLRTYQQPYTRGKIKKIPLTVLHVELLFVYFPVFPQDIDLNSVKWNYDSHECVRIWKDTVVVTCMLRYFARHGLHAVHTRYL